MINARIDKETERKLSICMDKTGMTKTGVIRAGIELIYEKVK